MEQEALVQNAIYISLGFIYVVTLLVTSRISGSFDIFSPPMVFAIFVTIGVFLRSIYFSLYNNITSYEVIGTMSENILSYGYLAMGLSILSYCCGYLLVGAKIIKINYVSSNKSNVYLYILMAYSIIALAMYYQKMGVFVYGPFTSRYYIMEDLGRASLTYLVWGADILFIIFLFKLNRVKRLRSLRVSDFVFLIIPLFTAAVTTNRGNVILYLIGVMCVCFSLTGKKFPYVKFGLLVLLVIGGLGSIRSEMQSAGEGHSENKKSIFTTTFEHLMERPYHLAIDKTSVIVYKTLESENYLMGKSFSAIFLAPIPRLFWPEKPGVRIGPWVATEIYERENKSGVPPGFIGELFLNFSWLGVLLGMFLYGMACRLIYNSHKARSMMVSNYRIFYAIFLVSFVIRLVGADFVGAGSLFLRQVIPFLIIASFTNFYLTSRKIHS